MRMRDDDGHHAMLAAGKAWAEIKESRKRTWSDYTMIIGPALTKARAEAMARAETNQPLGKGYNMQMGELLKEYALDDMKETVRAHILKIMGELDLVEEWRAKQKDPDDLNHPTRVWTSYQRSAKKKDERDANKQPTKAEQLAIELTDALEREHKLIAELEAARSKSNDLQALDAGTIVDLIEALPASKKKAVLHDLDRELGGSTKKAAAGAEPIEETKSWNHTFSVGDRVFDIPSQREVTILKIFKNRDPKEELPSLKPSDVNPDEDDIEDDIFVTVDAPADFPDAETYPDGTRTIYEFCLLEEAERYRAKAELGSTKKADDIEELRSAYAESLTAKIKAVASKAEQRKLFNKEMKAFEKMIGTVFAATVNKDADKAKKGKPKSAKAAIAEAAAKPPLPDDLSIPPSMRRT